MAFQSSLEGGALPLHQCLLEAKNDYKAIAAWLVTKHDPNGTGKTATHRAYRKEAERLLLWAIVEHGKPLSSLTVEDVNTFKWFLAAPPARWRGPRHHQRWSPLWRPLEGPLSSAALRQSIVILRSLLQDVAGLDFVHPLVCDGRNGSPSWPGRYFFWPELLAAP